MHTGYLELFDLVVKHILPGMGLFFTLCCISIVNSSHKKKVISIVELLRLPSPIALFRLSNAEVTLKMN